MMEGGIQPDMAVLHISFYGSTIVSQSLSLSNPLTQLSLSVCMFKYSYSDCGLYMDVNQNKSTAIILK